MVRLVCTKYDTTVQMIGSLILQVFIGRTESPLTSSCLPFAAPWSISADECACVQSCARYFIYSSLPDGTRLIPSAASQQHSAGNHAVTFESGFPIRSPGRRLAALRVHENCNRRQFQERLDWDKIRGLELW